MLTLDMDYAPANTWTLIQETLACRCCVYSTHKHTPEAPRLRLIIPLARAVSEEEYPALGRQVADRLIAKRASRVPGAGALG